MSRNAFDRFLYCFEANSKCTLTQKNSIKKTIRLLETAVSGSLHQHTVCTSADCVYNPLRNCNITEIKDALMITLTTGNNIF